MSSTYKPRALPKRLDFSKSDGNVGRHPYKNSKLLARDHSPDQASIPLSPDIQSAFLNLVKENLRNYVEKRVADGQGNSRTIMQNDSDIFRGWVREFHSEYDDAWFEVNERRLLEPFRKIWDEYWAVILRSCYKHPTEPLIDL